MHSLRRTPILLASVVLSLLLPLSASAVTIIHNTDGIFTNGAEWNPLDVKQVKTFFPLVGNAGGAYLYVEQGDGQNAFGRELYLMYDYVHVPVGAVDPNTFFDVFFQVPSDAHDYLVRIHPGGSLETFEKPVNVTSNTAPDGSFDTGAPWTPLSAGDLALAHFEGAIGFGPSPDSAIPHLMAEFELTVNVPASDPFGEHPGIYDPAPAFWSASKGNTGAADPPISSAIFQLNPDGTIFVTPVLDGFGAPIAQLPEPASLSLIALGAATLLHRRRQS